MRRRRRGRLSSTSRLSLTVAALAALWIEPHAASAAELVVEDAASCTTRDELSFRVERLLGTALENAPAMELSVRVESTGDSLGAELVVSRDGVGHPGVRAIRATSCAELSEALALAIVVAIGADPAPPTAAVAMPSAAMEAEPAPAEPIDEASPEAPSAAPTLAGSAWMVGDAGTLPGVGLGIGVGAELEWRSVELRALGTLLPEREGSLRTSDSSSPGASIGLIAASLLACVPVTVQPSALALAACAGWELGQISGDGTHVAVPYHQRTLWSAARLDLALRWPVPGTRLALEGLVTALAPFTRDDFILKDLGSVHRPASVLGRLGVGLSVAID